MQVAIFICSLRLFALCQHENCFRLHPRLQVLLLEALAGFKNDELDEMRREAINNVRRTRGKIKLDDIAKGWYNEK